MEDKPVPSHCTIKEERVQRIMGICQKDTEASLKELARAGSEL